MGAEDPEDDAPATVVSPHGRAAKSRSGRGGEGTATRLAAGEHVGRYVIEEAMAEGGMGVVYLAHDPELDRKVAIKLIRPGGEAENLEDNARLMREAQAMARLSHPNVVVVHDVGTASGMVFLAMEFVRGRTLRRWLADEPRSWREIVGAFLAAGRGLAAAHEVGIVHRDFKPDNVLVRDDGRVQVTDFGLARDAAVTESTTKPVRPPASLLNVSVTVTGDLLGTPLYMAPEQHRRDPTDARTDQFSFAVSLYSALCGRHPFGDPKRSDFGHRVLEGKLDPPSSNLPSRVRRALVRALDAGPANRFPTLEALLAELEAARSSRHTRMLAGAGAAAVAGIAVIVWSRGETTRAPLKVSRTVQLTREADLQLDPAPSPDGKRLAYVSGSLGHMRVFVRPEGGAPVSLTASLAGDHRWPQWSRDGQTIVFQVAEAGFESSYRIYTVPVAGGTPGLLLAPPGKSVAMPSLSPDGRSLAYVQFDQDWNPPWEVVVSDADGKNPRTLVTIDRHVTLSTPAWSPDGKILAYSHGNLSFFLRGNIAPAQLWVVPVAGGTPTQITSGTSVDHAPVWTRDGDSMLFVSDRDGTPDIYELPVDDHGLPRGPASRLTVGLHAHTIALGGERQLYCSVFSYRTNLWEIPIPPVGVKATLGDARPITSGHQIIESVDPSPDFKHLLFDSNRSGNQDVFVMPAGGGEPTQLTTAAANDFAPAWSPDGTRFAFHSFRTGTRNIFIANRDGTGVRQLTHGTFNHWNPRWSPDGKTLVFYSDRAEDWSIWKLSVEGEAQPIQVTPMKASVPRWSPDGTRIAFANRQGLWTIPAAEDNTAKPTHLLAQSEISNFNWSHDGASIYFRRHDGIPTIWVMPSTGGTPQRALELVDPVRHPDRVEFGVDDRRFLIPLTEHAADLWSIELAP